MRLASKRSSKGSDYKYMQIAGDLTDKIKNGFYEDERSFPSQNQLMKEYDVSLLTVRQVLNKLQGDGLIESHRGIGTFIRREQDTAISSWDRSHFIGLACINSASGTGSTVGYPVPNSHYVDIIKDIQSNNKELLSWFGSDVEELKQWSRRVGTLLLYNYVTNETIAEIRSYVPRIVMVGCLDGPALRHEVPSFDYDLIASATMGIDLLIKAGRSRIAYITDDTQHYANTSMSDAVMEYTRTHGVQCQRFVCPYVEQALIDHEPTLLEQLKTYNPDGILLKSGGSKLLFHYTNLTCAGYAIPQDLSLVALTDRSPLESDPESITRIRKHLPEDNPCQISDVTSIHGDSRMFKQAINFILSNKQDNLIVHETAAPQIHFGKSVGVSL